MVVVCAFNGPEARCVRFLPYGMVEPMHSLE